MIEMLRRSDRGAIRSDVSGDGGSRLRVAVIGAGVSGIAALRALVRAGFDVTVFERAVDVGGVWSATRAYPGIETQDDARTYGYTDGPIPNDRAGHAPGAEVRAYLERLVHREGLDARLRLRTAVVRADLEDDTVWRLQLHGPEGATVEEFDWLVAANGVFSTPHVPIWEGADEFSANGGRVVTADRIGDGDVLNGADVVVVGWGKTACDLAVVAASRAKSVHVIARTLTWKYPRSFGRLGLTFRHLVLTRGGERILHTRYRDDDDRLLIRRIPERLPRLALDRLLASTIDRNLGLSMLGLRPDVESRTSSSLVTEGFFEAVAEGRIVVHRESRVERLGRGSVFLSSGDVLPATVVVAATGYEQGLPFLSAAEVRRLRDAGPRMRLHRGVLAVDIPRLALIGWAHNYRSPLTAEISAAWLAGLLTGQVSRPGGRAQRNALRFVPLPPRSTTTAAAHLLPQMRFADLDRMLDDLGVGLPLRVRLRQIWTPLNPADYRRLRTDERKTVH